MAQRRPAGSACERIFRDQHRIEIDDASATRAASSKQVKGIKVHVGIPSLHKATNAYASRDITYTMNRISPSHLLFCIIVGSALHSSTVDAFTPPSSSAQVGCSSTIVVNVQHPSRQLFGSMRPQPNLYMAGDDSESSGSNSGVVELADDDEDDAAPSAAAATPAAPFLSQGEISPEALNPDLSDPKQTRVILYIIISLVPVLFLVPLMLGSRDLVPLESLPPVDL